MRNKVKEAPDRGENGRPEISLLEPPVTPKGLIMYLVAGIFNPMPWR
jgi:hypothetical protein